MSKKRDLDREEADDIHAAMIKHLREEQINQEALARFLEQHKPKRRVTGDALSEFEKAMYRLCYFAYKMCEEGSEEWKRVDQLVRDAAVGIIEFKQ